ncbi:hypothetical protein F25303_13231, partial [Fusarium sp. NRRL 25303]
MSPHTRFNSIGRAIDQVTGIGLYLSHLRPITSACSILSDLTSTLAVRDYLLRTPSSSAVRNDNRNRSMRNFLGKHSNRSSHALSEPRNSSKTPATSTPTNNSQTPPGGSAATPQAAGHQRQPSHQAQQIQPDQHYQVHQHQQLLDEADSASHGAHFGHSHSVGANANAASANASANNPSTINPHSALSSSHNTAFSSSESFDSQQPPPPPHYLQNQQPPLHLQHPQQQPQ